MPPKYCAFISYRSTDARKAAWLHQTLETFRTPKDLVGTAGDFGPVPAQLGRVYRDRDEARSAADIETVIAHELAQSEHLVVLCTPQAAAPGSWVPREIELFRQRRPGGRIHAVIGRGAPPECFPEPLLRRGPDGRVDAPLAADIRSFRDGGQDGPQRGAVRLIAALLGVPFDALWRREERRLRTRRLTRIVQLATAASVALALVWAGNWYRGHSLVDVDVSSVGSVADRVHVEASEQAPDDNGSRVFWEDDVSGGRLRFFTPTSNVVVRVRATYRDGAARSLALHLTLSPGFRPGAKHLVWQLPAASEIAARAGMALVPATDWVHGMDRERRTSASPFWIDIRPPTTAEYGPIAARLVAEGRLDPANSFVATAATQQAAAERTGLSQLKGLSKDLGDIFGIIASAAGPEVSAPGDIVAGMAELPCATCPPPMTRHEAEVYCSSRGMRLPTALEWELAVRGVDGRVYPWGNRFDPGRANVPGLPAKGEPAPRLAPVDQYAAEESPFGLIDTVGNAGDWVVNDVGSYERVYMGATYRFSPEDATAFRMLPVTDSDYLVREVTARCVATAAR